MCYGVGNNGPLHYYCLENPLDRNLVGYSPWGHKKSDTTEYTIAYMCWYEKKKNLQKEKEGVN